jgi:hypothetical protein
MATPTGTGVGSEANELFRMIRRDEGRLVEVESGDPFDHAFGDGGSVEVEVKNLGHHVVGEHVGVVTGIEHQRARVGRHLALPQASRRLSTFL